MTSLIRTYLYRTLRPSPSVATTSRLTPLASCLAQAQAPPPALGPCRRRRREKGLKSRPSSPRPSARPSGPLSLSAPPRLLRISPSRTSRPPPLPTLSAKTCSLALPGHGPPRSDYLASSTVPPFHLCICTSSKATMHTDSYLCRLSLIARFSIAIVTCYPIMHLSQAII
jgi:hypothetical protein